MRRRWDSLMTIVNPRLDALQARYHASLGGKRADIEQAWSAVRANCADTASQETLLRLIHRLAGSAESYGFVAIGKIAARVDMRFDRVRGSAGASQQAETLRGMLETLESEIGELLAELQRGVESRPEG